MTQQEKKEFLREYVHLKEGIKELEEELLELRIGKINPHSVITGVVSSENKKDTSDYIAAVEVLENKILRQKYRKIKKYMEIHDGIIAINIEREQRLLRLKYIKNMSWEDVAKQMSYSASEIYKIHSDALIHIEFKK